MMHKPKKSWIGFLPIIPIGGRGKNMRLNLTRERIVVPIINDIKKVLTNKSPQKKSTGQDVKNNFSTLTSTNNTGRKILKGVRRSPPNTTKKPSSNSTYITHTLPSSSSAIFTTTSTSCISSSVPLKTVNATNKSSKLALHEDTLLSLNTISSHVEKLTKGKKTNENGIIIERSKQAAGSHAMTVTMEQSVLKPILCSNTMLNEKTEKTSQLIEKATEVTSLDEKNMKNLDRKSKKTSKITSLNDKPSQLDKKAKITPIGEKTNTRNKKTSQLVETASKITSLDNKAKTTTYGKADKTLKLDEKAKITRVDEKSKTKNLDAKSKKTSQLVETASKITPLDNKAKTTTDKTLKLDEMAKITQVDEKSKTKDLDAKSEIVEKAREKALLNGKNKTTLDGKSKKTSQSGEKTAKITSLDEQTKTITLDKKDTSSSTLDNTLSALAAHIDSVVQGVIKVEKKFLPPNYANSIAAKLVVQDVLLNDDKLCCSPPAVSMAIVKFSDINYLNTLDELDLYVVMQNIPLAKHKELEELLCTYGTIILFITEEDGPEQLVGLLKMSDSFECDFVVSCLDGYVWEDSRLVVRKAIDIVG